MPSHKVHRAFLEQIMGKEASKYRWVDIWMDSTAPLRGSSHRKDIVHNPFFIYLISKGDPKALEAAVIHQVLDTAFTSTKKVINKRVKHK